jgi:hypothetical protein
MPRPYRLSPTERAENPSSEVAAVGPSAYHPGTVRTRCSKGGCDRDRAKHRGEDGRERLMARKAPEAEAATSAVLDEVIEVDVETDVQHEGGMSEAEMSAAEFEFEFDEELCRQRAYEISQSDEAGTPEENWLRAEQELRAVRTADDA